MALVEPASHAPVMRARSAVVLTEAKRPVPTPRRSSSWCGTALGMRGRMNLDAGPVDVVPVLNELRLIGRSRSSG
jgi:hypothetical protein